MGWSVGAEDGRFVGYGVPAYCDYPLCYEEIDRGMFYRCESDDGCCDSNFYCSIHSDTTHKVTQYKEHPSWIAHISVDPSWKKFREEDHELWDRMQSAVVYPPDKENGVDPSNDLRYTGN